MKTLKTKVILTPLQEELFDRLCGEADWVWNECLKVALRLHTRKYYAHLYKRAKKENIDLNGIIEVPLYFKDRSAWDGATCRIANCSNAWKKDPSIEITYKNSKGIECKKPGYRLLVVKDWERIEPQPYSPIVLAGKEIEQVTKLDSMTLLNQLRNEQNLPPLAKNSSDWVGGISGTKGRFIKAWKAYEDIKRKHSAKPEWKGRDKRTASLSQSQRTSLDLNRNLVTVQLFGEIQIVERDFADRVAKLKAKHSASMTIVREPSGFYVCLCFDTPQRVIKPKNKSVGIDPGIVNIVATSDGHLIEPEQTRSRLERHIKNHQKELSRLYEMRRIRLGLESTKGFKPESLKEQYHQKRIARLQERMRNSIQSFNHKLSSRLANTYDAIGWEDTSLQNMMQQVKDAPIDSDGKYTRNGRASKKGLNRSLKARSIGQLRQFTKQKVEELNGVFALSPSANSSQRCHCCGEKGDRISQSIFVCRNAKCRLNGIKQNADINAARNHEQAVKPKLSAI